MATIYVVSQLLTDDWEGTPPVLLVTEDRRAAFELLEAKRAEYDRAGWARDTPKEELVARGRPAPCTELARSHFWSGASCDEAVFWLEEWRS